MVRSFKCHIYTRMHNADFAVITMMRHRTSSEHQTTNSSMTSPNSTAAIYNATMIAQSTRRSFRTRNDINTIRNRGKSTRIAIATVSSSSSESRSSSKSHEQTKSRSTSASGSQESTSRMVTSTEGNDCVSILSNHSFSVVDDHRKPRLATQVIEYNHELCFSMKPVLECPTNTYPVDHQTESKKVSFGCLPRTDSQSVHLEREVQRQHIINTDQLKPSFVESVFVPIQCKRL